MKKILIYGGSFDPVHNAHIKMVRKVMKALDIDKVIFELAKSPRWKTPNVDAKHRLNMLKMAIEGHDEFELDLYEFNSNDKVNYTINTVRHLKKKYKDDMLFLLIGFDQLNVLDKWYMVDELKEEIQIVAYNRNGNVCNHENIIKYNVLVVDGPTFNVSSTLVRELKSIDVKQNILRYILDNRLYFAKNVQWYLSDRRYEHSCSVALLSLLFARLNKMNQLDAFKAGLLHDIGKDQQEEVVMKIMKEHFSNYLDLPPFSYHQFVGSYIASKEFGINKKSIINAIKFHATGSDNMNKLAMLLYSADKIEPTRNFDSSSLIKEVAEDIKKGYKTVLEANKEYLLSHNKDINNRLTKACFDKYL